MKITIIGSGNVGGALAQAFLKAGHEVKIGAQFPLSEKSKKLSSLIGEQNFATIADAVSNAEVIVITTPPEAILNLTPQLGDVRNKVVIDATNSIRTRPEPFPTAYHAIRKLANTERVVKCFNTTGFENMLNPDFGEAKADMFIAGGDAKAKQTAMQLATDIGFGKCYDFGGDDKVELIEQFAFCWINLAIMRGEGRNIAFHVIRR